MEGGIPKGTQVGSYVVDSLLGRGGMGIVYRAYHPRLQRWTAIKMLPPFTGDTDSRERFEREARAIARLRHRHILSVFDFGEFAGQPYMAVEFMPNGSLQDKMPGGAVSVAQALTLLRPLAEALDYAHAQGVLHRDVKPANVFLDSDMQPVLADFGLAKLYSEESVTASGLVSGTPTHMSPEQANGRPLSGATDQYALGVMAFSLLTGRLPFQGQLMELLYAHVNKEPPAASSINPSLNPLVDGVLGRALAKDPNARYPTCLALVSGLEAAAAGRLDERVMPRPAPEVPVTVIATPAAAAVRPAAGGGRSWLYAVAVVAIVLVIGLTAYATGAVKLPFLAGANTPESTGTGGGSPAPAATPTPPAVAIEQGTSLKKGEQIHVVAHNLVVNTGDQPTAGILQGLQIHPISGIGMAPQPDGSYTEDGVVPADVQAGSATLVACPRPTSDTRPCAKLNVTIS